MPAWEGIWKNVGSAPQVVCRVYDISLGMAKQMSLAVVGKQFDIIPHTGIYVYGARPFFLLLTTFRRAFTGSRFAGREFFFGGPQPNQNQESLRVTNSRECCGETQCRCDLCYAGGIQALRPEQVEATFGLKERRWQCWSGCVLSLCSSVAEPVLFCTLS